MKLAEKKHSLREELLVRRNALSKEEWSLKSHQIQSRLKSRTEIREARTIHTYISMVSRNEADTLNLIQDLIDTGKDIMVPVIQPGTFLLNHSLLRGINDLKAQKWGVLEPKKTTLADPQTVDLILVPMVGADENKNRIGYGKGFYDRFLSESDKLKIGLCFECCIVDEIPVEHFDVALDMIVTEKRVIT